MTDQESTPYQQAVELVRKNGFAPNLSREDYFALVKGVEAYLIWLETL